MFGANTSAGTYSVSGLYLASGLFLIWLTLRGLPQPFGIFKLRMVGEPSAQHFTDNSVRAYLRREHDFATCGSIAFIRSLRHVRLVALRVLATLSMIAFSVVR